MRVDLFVIVIQHQLPSAATIFLFNISYIYLSICVAQHTIASAKKDFDWQTNKVSCAITKYKQNQIRFSSPFEAASFAIYCWYGFLFVHSFILVHRLVSGRHHGK